MPHYILDARTATPHFPGIGRYVSNLAEAMVPQLGGDERLTVLERPGYPVELPDHPATQSVVVNASPFSLRQQRVVPRVLREVGGDLYHSPYYLMPYRLGIPSILTVHDLIPLLFPEYSSWRARWLFRRMTAMALRASTRTIAVSHATRQDVLTYFAAPPDQITAIPEAADPHFFLQPESAVHNLRQRYDLWDPFVLYVGSNKPHKNLVRLVEAWAEVTPSFPHITLVIAGSWISTYPEARTRAEQLDLSNRAVRWLGPLSEKDLPALYGAATLFVFPSLYEGFGLPVIEAMACGAPVACSRVSSLPEVVGDSALLFDPEHASSIAEAIAQALGDDALRADLRERGLHRVSEFSWERTARETLELYRQVLGTEPSIATS